MSRHLHHRTAMVAGAVLRAAVEPVEHRRELGLDIFEMKVLLVKFVMAVLAKP